MNTAEGLLDHGISLALKWEEWSPGSCQPLGRQTLQLRHEVEAKPTPFPQEVSLPSEQQLSPLLEGAPAPSVPASLSSAFARSPTI